MRQAPRSEPAREVAGHHLVDVDTAVPELRQRQLGEDDQRRVRGIVCDRPATTSWSNPWVSILTTSTERATRRRAARSVPRDRYWHAEPESGRRDSLSVANAIWHGREHAASGNTLRSAGKRRLARFIAEAEVARLGLERDHIAPGSDAAGREHAEVADVGATSTNVSPGRSSARTNSSPVPPTLPSGSGSR